MENTKLVNIYCIRKSGEDVWKEYKSIFKIHNELKLNRVKLKEAFEGKTPLLDYETQVKITYKPMSSSDIWKVKNPKRAKDNRDFNNSKQRQIRLSEDNTNIYTLARKYGSNGEWTRFASQIDAAKKLGLSSPNISHVLKGKITQTGGYEFKKEILKIETPKPTTQWKDVCQEKGYKNASGGMVSPQRILHSKVDDNEGKVCCTCKLWKLLENYNSSDKHWDNLRNDCKECLTVYRENNKDKIKEFNKNYQSEHRKEINEYQKQRRLKNRAWRIRCNMGSRLSQVVAAQGAVKVDTTNRLVGCTYETLLGHLESKFTPEMSWDNYAIYWEVDHIIPCIAFNLVSPLEQSACFHFTNLQPMSKLDNASKGGTCDIVEKDNYMIKFIMNYIDNKQSMTPPHVCLT